MQHIKILLSTIIIIGITTCILSIGKSQELENKTATGGRTLTPQIQFLAEFVTKPRCPVYEMSEQVSLWLAVDGIRMQADQLQWSVNNYNGAVLDKGVLEIPKGTDRWTNILNLKNYGAGYFEIKLKLGNSGSSIPQYGTRPPGLVAYGVLPAIERLPLKHVDDSRFGAQGTNFVQSGEFMKGNCVDPVYPLLGAKWVYLNRHIGELYLKGDDAYKPNLNPESFKNWPGFESKAGLALLVDLHSIPPWLANVPAGGSINGNSTEAGQRYAPNDFNVYKKLVAKLVSEQVVRRDAAFLNQSKNYYQIHWEPDWHWKGSDEEFIKMYQAAHEAIKENDPRGLLLGPNYGVLRTGNKLLKQLFAKGLGKYMDGMLTHTYYLTQGAEARQSLVDDMRELFSMTRKYLPPDAKIINTEWGVIWKSPPETDPDTLRSEIADFMRGHLIALGEGADTTFFFYTADMGKSGGGLLYNLTWPNPGCGATHVAPKPVFMAAATATRLLEGTKSIGAIEYLGTEILGYAFDRNGEIVICLWSKDDQARTIKIPVGNVAKVALVDPMGNEQEATVTDGTVAVNICNIPTWVRGLDPKVLSFGTKVALKAFAGENVILPVTSASGEIRLFEDGKWVDAGSNNMLSIPHKIGEGRRLIGIFAAGTGKLTITIPVVIRPVLDITTSKTPQPGLLKLDLINRQSQKVTGTAILKADEKIIATKTVSIGSGNTEELNFDIRQLTAASRLMLEFTDRSGARCIFAPPPLKTLIPSAYAEIPPTIDGKLNDWRLELFCNFEDSQNPDLSKQMNVRIGAQYDKNNLYLAFKIHDKEHVQTRHFTGLWHGDSIQIGLAVHPEGQVWKSWQKLAFGCNSKFGQLNCYRDTSDAFPIGLVKQNEISWAFVRNGDESCYEIAIPWCLAGKNLNGPPAEGFLGMGVMVNNVDLVSASKETPRQYLDVLGGMSWSKPEDFGILELK